MSFFSVIIPSYNLEKCITRSISSVLEQTFTDFELIIVDDGSTDNTVNVIRKIYDSRLNLICNSHRGVSAARNTAIKMCKSQYICFIDGDDYWYPNHLEIIKDNIECFANASFFATATAYKLKDGTIKNQPYKVNKSVFIEDYLAFCGLNLGSFDMNCVCIRKDAFERFGYFEEYVKIAEDLDLFTRITIHTGFVFIPQYTSLYYRDYNHATRFRALIIKNVSFDRMNDYLADETINDTIKESLKKYYYFWENNNIKGMITCGEKKEGFILYKKIPSEYISIKEKIKIFIGLIIPSKILLYRAKIKSRNYYDGIVRDYESMKVL